MPKGSESVKRNSGRTMNSAPEQAQPRPHHRTRWKFHFATTASRKTNAAGGQHAPGGGRSCSESHEGRRGRPSDRVAWCDRRGRRRHRMARGLEPGRSHERVVLGDRDPVGRSPRPSWSMFRFATTATGIPSCGGSWPGSGRCSTRRTSRASMTRPCMAVAVARRGRRIGDPRKIVQLDAADARVLSRQSTLALNHVRQLSEAAAKELARQNGRLELNGLGESAQQAGQAPEKALGAAVSQPGAGTLGACRRPLRGTRANFTSTASWNSPRRRRSTLPTTKHGALSLKRG